MTPPADARAVFRDKAGNVTGWLAGPKLSDVEIYRLARRWCRHAKWASAR